MGNPKHDKWLDAAIEAELDKLQDASRSRSEAANEQALAELQRSLETAAQELKDLRQPTLPELAIDTVDKLHRAAARLFGCKATTGAAQLRPETMGIGSQGKKADRRAAVHAFLLRCRQETSLKATKKHIWRAVGHTAPRQFQYWQAGQDRLRGKGGGATGEDDRNFRRVLAMEPTDFVALLTKRGIS